MDRAQYHNRRWPMKKTVWMFAGQGSQHYLMGRELFEQEPVFREHLLQADEIFRDRVNESLVEILYRPRRDRFEPFKRVLHSSPAILAVECALAQLLLSRGLRPDYLLGHSLGEIASMVTSGALPFEDAMLLVIKQSELLEYCAPAGGMLAVLESSDLAEQFPAEFAGCEIAGWNFARSFLVSGKVEPLLRLKAFLKHRGVSVFELPVAHAFHSRWTDLVATPARALLARLAVAPPRIPMISAAHGQLGHECQVAELWQAIRSRIDFPRTMRQLEAIGPFLYVDLGPSGNMATAVKYNLAPHSKSEFASIITPFGQDARNLSRFLEALSA